MSFSNSITTQQELLDLLTDQYNAQHNQNKKEVRYIIYTRVSTDDVKQSGSLEDQEKACVEFANKKGLKFINVLAEQESAKESEKREQFGKMIKDIRAGKYKGIIAWHPDRLARNMKDAGEIIDLLDKKIIEDLQFPAYQFDNTPTGK